MEISFLRYSMESKIPPIDAILLGLPLAVLASHLQPPLAPDHSGLGFRAIIRPDQDYGQHDRMF